MNDRYHAQQLRDALIHAWREAAPEVQEAELRRRANIVWEDAIKRGHLGGLIHACRVRLGETQEKYGARLAAVSGWKKPFGQTTIANWEADDKLPMGIRGSGATETLCESMVRMMKLAECEFGTSLPLSDQPWFDPEKEAAFRNAFIARTNRSNSVRNKYGLPSDAVSPAITDPITFPRLPLTAIGEIGRHDGKLNPGIMPAHLRGEAKNFP